LRNFSQAADNNKTPILDQLTRLFIDPGTVLEVGSGGGQHALHFAKALPHLTWQPTDQGDYFKPLLENMSEFASANVLSPVYLDVSEVWQVAHYEYAYIANVLHIMAAEFMAPFFAGLGRHLKVDAICCIYGPFRYQGRFTTESNARFDEWLKDKNPASGIRDAEIVIALAEKNGLSLREDIVMPANNQLLVFKRQACS